MVNFILILVGLVCGGLGSFFAKKINDERQKRSARAEADRIINKAKAESAKIDRESKNRAKDFETRARKNAELEIQKQKSKLKQQESQLERKLKDVDDDLKRKLEENDRFLLTLKDREGKLEITENRIKDLEKKAEEETLELKAKLSSVAQMGAEEAKR